MSGRQGNRVVATATVVLGLVLLILIKVMRKNITEHSIINRILGLAGLGIDSVKDVLEVLELHLHVDKIFPTGVRITWNNDNSDKYILLLSSDPIRKMDFLNLNNIKDYNKLEDLSAGKTNWIRKFYINGNVIQVFFVPLKEFHCRIKSSKGRLSRELEYTENKHKPNDSDKEIEVWLTKDGHQNVINIKEPAHLKSGDIHEYRVYLYYNDGRGDLVNIPIFNNKVTSFNLGTLDHCLCHIIGYRTIGRNFEKYVGWIGEDQSLAVDGLLDEFKVPVIN